MELAKKPEDPWTKFALGIFKLNGLITQMGESISRPLGQSGARWHVLGHAFEPQTVAEMARDVGLARQSIQRVADVLAGEGLVAYVNHPTDRRTKIVELTPRGLDALKTLYKHQVLWSDPVVAELGPEQLAEIASQLESVSHVIASHIKKGGKRRKPSKQVSYKRS